ncbi:MAG: response regulator [Candidatus Kapaibacteriota bacterium]|jgi:CheY-like chemotaxis protein
MPNSENKIYDSENENESNETNELMASSEYVTLDNVNSEAEVNDENLTTIGLNDYNSNILDTKAEDLNNIEEVQPNQNTIDTTKNKIAEALDVYNILTIDDDKWIQRIFTQYLSQWGFNNISALDPYTGLEEAIKSKPLIIFLDILLPEVHGDMLIKFLKKMKFIDKTPIVIISGNLSKDLIKSTYLSGAAGFIIKPFTQETLFNKIKEVIDPAIFDRMVKDGKINTAQIKKKPHLGV